MFEYENLFKKVFPTPELQARVDESALRASYIGLGGLVKIEIKDGKPSYVISGTGEIKKTIQEAMQRIQSIYLTKVTKILGPGDRPKFGSTIGAVGGIMEEIQAAYGRLADPQKELLKQIGVEDVRSLEFDVVTLGGQKGAKVGQSIAELRKNNTLDGFFLVDDDSGRIITARSGQKFLNNFQLTTLFRMTGHELITEAAFEKESFGKIPKRIRTLISEREVSLSQGNFQRFLGVKNAKELTESILITDPQYELLKMAASIEEGKAFSLGDERLDAYYRGRDYKNYFGTYLDQLDDKGIRQEFFDIIRSYQEDTSVNFQSDALKKHFENAIKGRSKEEELKEIFKKIYDEIEYTFDGSDLLNQKFYTRGLAELRKRKNRLEKLGDTKSKREAEEIANILSQLEDSKLNQITGRGRIKLLNGKTLDIKTAFHIFTNTMDASSSIFNEAELENVSMIISKFGLKPETGFGGPSNKLMMSGFGRGIDNVFSDPVSTAFHPELFADPDTMEAIENRAQTILAEYRSVLEEGVIPQKLKNQLQQMAKQPTDFVEVGKRVSAQRNRELAKKTLELINMGIDPRQSPRMMNMLHTLYHTQIYKVSQGYKGDEYKLVLPETYRFALDTEASLHPEQARLGKGFEKITGFTKSDGTRVALNDQVADILKFRVKDGTIFFGTETMLRVRESLGGFDLDDKGIARIFRYTDDNGMTRIAFNLTRQPSGVEETMIGRALFDEDTVRELMKGEYFKKAIDALTNPFANTAKINMTSSQFLAIDKLREIAYEEETIASKFGAQPVQQSYDQIEMAIAQVYEQMEKMGFTKVRKMTDRQIDLFGKFGFSTIQGTEPAYTRAGIYRLFTQTHGMDLREEIKIAAQEAKASGLKDNIADKLMQLANTPIKSIKVEKQIEEISKVMEQIRTAIENSEIGKAIFESAFQLSTAKVADDLAAEGSIGVYTNRSMIIGSNLQQYEDLLLKGNLDDQVKEYLFKNFQIGLLSSEGAIDPATQGAGKVIIDEDTIYAAFRKAQNTALVSRGLITDQLGAGLGEKGIERSLQVLTKKQGGTAVMGLEAIESLARRIGFIRMISGIDEDLQQGVDAIVMRDRLSETDAQAFLKNVLSGMESGQSVLPSLGQQVNAEGIKLYEDLKNLVDADKGTISAKLIEIFGLQGGHKYAGQATQDRIGQTLESMTDSMQNSYFKKISEDIIKSTITSQESDTLAKSIINRNQRMYNEFFSQSAEQLRAMTEVEKTILSRMRQMVSADILSQIDEASQLKGISLLDLVNSFAKLRRQTGFDIEKFDIEYINTEGLNDAAAKKIERLQEVQKNITIATSRREVNYYKKMKTQQTDDFITSYASGKTYSELEQEMIDLVKNAQANISDDLDRAIAQVIARQPEEIADASLKREAQKEAKIIQQVLLDEENAQIYQDIEQRGTISTVDEAISQFGDDTTITEDIIRSVDELEEYDPINKATYKRLSQKIKDKEISKLFKDPIIRKGSLAIGALILGSFAYTAIKDRTQDDMAGPPLLPGGSSYEENYPVRIPEIGTFGGQGYNSGMSYNISINGSQEDMQRFNEAARGLVNGSTSTTIYEGLPNMTQDPYRRMASQY